MKQISSVSGGSITAGTLGISWMKLGFFTMPAPRIMAGWPRHMQRPHWDTVSSRQAQDFPRRREAARAHTLLYRQAALRVGGVSCGIGHR
jgi:hypothetical protein